MEIYHPTVEPWEIEITDAVYTTDQLIAVMGAAKAYYDNPGSKEARIVLGQCLRECGYGD